jgi:hypothetical protein
LLNYVLKNATNHIQTRCATLKKTDNEVENRFNLCPFCFVLEL